MGLENQGRVFLPLVSVANRSSPKGYHVAPPMSEGDDNTEEV